MPRGGSIRSRGGPSSVDRCRDSSGDEGLRDGSLRPAFWFSCAGSAGRQQQVADNGAMSGEVGVDVDAGDEQIVAFALST